MKRYRVETEFRRDERTVILETNDYARATETTNFWDERQNTWLIDRLALNPLELALLRLDEVENKMHEALDKVPSIW